MTRTPLDVLADTGSNQKSPHAHRLEGKVIADRCGSDAFPFQPAKYFGRNNEVYKAFVRYVPGDKVYELIIHPEDADLF